MEKARLLEWAERLLDTGKRNNLIRYKRTKSTSLAIAHPAGEELFARAEAGVVFDVYKAEEKTAGLTLGEFCDTYSKRVKKNQILVYNELSESTAVLNSIRKRAAQTIEESGVNIAYMAFGFLSYREKSSGEELSAPLLLIPVSVERESLASGFRVRVLDDEVTVNPALSFKMQLDFGVALPEYSGAGLSEYLGAVSGCFGSLGFTTSKDAVLGLFSFQKINMYRDIVDNFDTISKSSLISVLMGDVGATVKNAPSRAGEPCPVIDADSSQLAAIKLARGGVSFVLQGPPGTGKSQTITNIIADSILLGKRVLFVSEKLAALNVVYDKLSRCSLSEFCLELYSHKANKKSVIDEICRVASLEKTAISDKADAALTEHLVSLSTLDGYRDALFCNIKPINKCARELIVASREYREFPDVEYTIENINTLGDEYLERAASVLDNYAAYASMRGTDYKKCAFYGYTGRKYGYSEEMALKGELAAAISWVDGLIKLSDAVRSLIGVAVSTPTAAKGAEELLSLVAGGDFVCPALFGDGAAERVLSSLDKIEGAAAELCAVEDKILAEWCESVFTLNADALAMALGKYSSGIKRLFSKEYRRIKETLSAAKRGEGRGRVKYSEAKELADTLVLRRRATKKYEAVASEISYYLGDGYIGERSDFSALRKEVTPIASANDFGVDLTPVARYSAYELDGARERLAALADEYRNLFDGAPCILEKFDTGEYNPYKTELSSLREKLDRMLSDLPELASYVSLCEMLSEMDALGLRPYIDTVISRKFSPKDIKGAYLRVFYTEWADFAIGANKYLGSLNRIIHDREWERFVRCDAASLEINRVKIKAALSNRRPDLDMISQGSKIGMLLREGEKKRRRMSIRRLFAELGDVAQAIKPCFLMSPISISTYLSPEMEFDLVVFDEASQVFPEDAFGAIYRASQLIVVGDSKQMPPTSFFTSAADDDGDFGESDAGDFESILDLCHPCMPSCSLNWHYRSKSEELIAFSNEHFYDGKLITFPSAREGERGLGVDYVFAGGVFNRAAKVNEKEADEVVRLLFDSLEGNPSRSVGIVAFSAAQQAAIEEKINARRIKDTRFEHHFATGNFDGVFVKNLETVQGDERDVIIFSTAYGRGDDGRLLMNFGPLNRDGGERRLNVAVTRARYNLILVSSMHYTDIDPTRVTSLGANLLREYLKYAECKSDSLAYSERGECADALVGEVCSVLSDNGVDFDVCYGKSRAKIDIAIKGEGGYILAVECDGGAFATECATDRERLRPAVLRGCGFSYYRIWSVDWYRNKNEEIARLLSAVKGARREHFAPAETPTEEVADTEMSTEDFACVAHGFEFPKYEYVDVNKIERVCGGTPSKIIRAVLEVESPVSEEWLMRRMLGVFGKDRMSGFVSERFEIALTSSELIDVLRRGGYLYLAGRKMPMMRIPDEECDVVREIKYIPSGEIAIGMREIIRQNGTLTRDGLYRLVSGKLGFARLTDSAREKFDIALSRLSGEITVTETEDGETISYRA